MEMAVTEREIVFTDTDRCVGCNKCIRNCPVVGANIAYVLNGENRVRVDQERCIRCGACLEACSHDARVYVDDTEEFFRDLGAGKKISVVVAPAARVNFDEHGRLIGFLKSRGVHLAYDVSFGADITTWAYLKAIREKGLSSVIAQPCPAIVNYIEKYQPELLSNLAPVHSPTLCTAVYLRKYAKSTDAIAFISPCIGKVDEFRDPATGGLVSYNVTYGKLAEYLEKNHIALSAYDETAFDDIGCWLGCVYSRPGGLRENVETLVPGAWVRQVEGPKHAYPYLAEYGSRMKAKKNLPLLVDILNCANGCNRGTATLKRVSIDDADGKLNALKAEKLIARAGPFKKKSEALFKMFDAKLKLADFMRTYRSRRVTLASPSDTELEAIYAELHKDTEASRKIDCSACGYHTCEDMARAIHNGINGRTNCIDFNRKEIAREGESIGEKTKIIGELSSYSAAVVSVLDEIDGLNLDVRLDGDFSGEFAEIRDSINRILDTLNMTLTEIREYAEQFGAGAEQVSQGSNNIAEGVGAQGTAMDKLSSLIGMLTAKTKQNAANAERARALSAMARESAEDGNRRMGEMLKSMEEINEASANITKILGVIDDIAFQTNILALNAAVEAARAGKYGKGFAVVADEVRNLAQRCSGAAKESAGFIEASVSRVKNGSGIANETASALAKITQKSSEIAAIVEEIAATSAEQTGGIDTINVNLQQVSHVVQSNSSASQESAEASVQLSQQAVSLKESVSRFRLRG
jgi:methyl-accepting chemotaxis protein/NAD-dependent dihydropyrimidine dehydrogenase PreA subunit